MRSTSIEALIPELFEAAVGVLPWDGVLGRIAGWLGARRVDLIGVADATAIVAFRYQGRVAAARRPDRPDAEDPRPAASVGDPLTRAIHEAMPSTIWSGLPLDREFRVHGDGLYFTSLPLAHEGGHVVAMIVVTDDGDGTEQDERSRRLRLIRAQLKRAIQVASRVAVGEAESRLRKQMVDVIGHPIVLIDADRRILDTNTAGAEYLAQDTGVLHGEQMLVCRHGPDEETLRTAIDRLFERGGLIPRATLSVRLGGDDANSPVAVILIAVGDPGRPRVMLVIHAIGAPTRIDYGLLGSTFGLTLAEAKVASLLLQGSTPQAVAEQNFISMTTVRSHLKSLFAKTACRRQADLVRIVCGLPQLRVHPLDELRRRRTLAVAHRVQSTTTFKTG